ncbi:MAG: DNA adenine methylase [Planctomycetota bacterium]|jgi:DNA adenine methylase
MVVTRQKIKESAVEGFLSPVLRWAGGKKHLVPKLLEFLPHDYSRLVEPMAGSAALFFAASPRAALLADSNPELINFYQVLARRTPSLITRLMELTASRSKYYEFRLSKPRSKFERAVRFIYLNRLCWNGLYRVNRQGEYNVPMGNRLPAKLWDADHLERAGRALRKAQLTSCDFQETLALCATGDVVYLDPPYPRRRREGRGFNRYTAVPFSEYDHDRMAQLAADLDDRGVRLMITAPTSKEFLSRFPKTFRVHEVASKSLISCNGKTRGKVREAILTNYD